MKGLFDFFNMEKKLNVFEEMELRKIPGRDPFNFNVQAIEVLSCEKLMLISGGKNKSPHKRIYELLTGYDISVRSTHSLPKTFEWSETEKGFVIEKKLPDAIDFLLENQAFSKTTADKVLNYISSLDTPKIPEKTILLQH